MRSKKSLSLGLALLMLAHCWGCLPRPKLALPAGVTLQPGRYLKEYYRAPGFAPEKAVYRLEPFTLEEIKNIAPDAFQPLLAAELTRAWEANGLKLSPRGDTTLSGTVQVVRVNRSLRFLFGKISADLIISGALTREGEILFVFLDRIHMVSPVSPGTRASKENELILQAALQTFSSHLLNELLLQGIEAPGGG
jgi:hypothetical protein